MTLVYIFTPFIVGGIVQLILNLITPKVQENEAFEGKPGKPQRKARDESALVDMHSKAEAPSSAPKAKSSVVAREEARKAERQEPAPVAAEPDTFALPDDFDMAEYRSARE